MKTYTQVIEEADGKAMPAKEVVAILQSESFGMSRKNNAGNGEAFIQKGEIVIKDSCFYGCDDKRSMMVKDWTQSKGSYFDYFKEEYNVVLRLVNSEVDFTGGKIYGKKATDGVVTLTLTV